MYSDVRVLKMLEYRVQPREQTQDAGRRASLSFLNKYVNQNIENKWVGETTMENVTFHQPRNLTNVIFTLANKRLHQPLTGKARVDVFLFLRNKYPGVFHQQDENEKGLIKPARATL